MVILIQPAHKPKGRGIVSPTMAQPLHWFPSALTHHSCWMDQECSDRSQPAFPCRATKLRKPGNKQVHKRSSFHCTGNEQARRRSRDDVGISSLMMIAYLNFF